MRPLQALPQKTRGNGKPFHEFCNVSATLVSLV